MRDVEEVLGRELGEEDFRKTRSYNELSSKQIQEALLLAGESRLVAAVYLRHCVEHSDGYDDFIDEVLVERLLTPEEWGKSRVICYPEIESAKCMQTPAEDLLAPLRGLEGERWFRVTPTLEDWMGFSVYPGAPGVVQDAPYWKSFDGRFGCSRFGRRLEAKIDFEQIDNDAPGCGVTAFGLLVEWLANAIALRRSRSTHFLRYALRLSCVRRR